MSFISINKIVSTSASSAALPLRLAAGIIFTAHGAQKLFGWFGGYGLQGTAQFLDSIGVAPGLLMASLAGGTEFFGGLLLLLGLLVRPASVLLAFTMLVAILSVHSGNGLFLSNNGYEFALALLAISVSLLVTGGGSYSMDASVAKRLITN